MGAIHFSLDPALAKLFREDPGVEVFVETGTFQGDTIAAMREVFPEIHSVELSEELHKKARQRFEGVEGVHLSLGDSAECLRKIREQVAGRPTLFWLDAHWCVSEGTAGEKSQCPLLAELAALRPLGERDVVLIDDARLFLAPPGAPHETSDWPSFFQILEQVRALSGAHELMVLNDTILVYPATSSAKIADFAKQHGVDLLEALHKAKICEEWEGKHRDAAEYATRMESEHRSLLQYTKELERKLSKPLTRLANRLSGN